MILCICFDPLTKLCSKYLYLNSNLFSSKLSSEQCRKTNYYILPIKCNISIYLLQTYTELINMRQKFKYRLTGHAYPRYNRTYVY